MTINKFKFVTISTLIICLLFVSLAIGQTKIVRQTEGGGKSKSMMFTADNSLIIPGLTAVITSTDGKFKVDFIPSKDQRDPSYKEVDIQQGDIIMMFNGKRLKTMEQFHELFDAVKVGDEIKIGLKRGKDMVIAAFPKADASQMGGQMMEITHDIDGGPGEGKMMTKTMSFGGPGEDMEVYPMVGLGIMLTDSDDQLKVMQKLQIQGMKVTETDLQPEDIILSINDQPVKSGKEFNPIYDAVADGEKVSLEILRGEEKVKVIFNKPSTGGVRVMKRSGK